MAENTKISWTTHTFSPWWGCTKVGPGCDFCYAEAADKRYGGDHWGSGKPRRLIKDWTPPLKWQREAEKTGVRPWVFCASMADVFDNEVPPEWRARLWDVVRATPLLNWQFCTKRVGNAEKMMPDDWAENFRHCGLMLTVVTQEEADRDVLKLSNLKGRFGVSWVGLSMEPLLEQVTLVKRVEHADGSVEIWNFLAGTWQLFDGDHYRAGRIAKVDWVITGGESGPRARPASPAWFRSLRDQCAGAATPYHHKQNGEWLAARQTMADGTENFLRKGERPDVFHSWGGEAGWSVNVGREAAGRFLDGRIHDAMPAFQFPTGRLL
jgi:protein gp37